MKLKELNNLSEKELEELFIFNFGNIKDTTIDSCLNALFLIWPNLYFFMSRSSDNSWGFQIRARPGGRLGYMQGGAVNYAIMRAGLIEKLGL